MFLTIPVPENQGLTSQLHIGNDLMNELLVIRTVAPYCARLAIACLLMLTAGLTAVRANSDPFGAKPRETLCRGMDKKKFAKNRRIILRNR